MSPNKIVEPNLNKLVLADGCFDPLHVGHVRYLRYAAMLEDSLVVNIASDATIREKGREPFQTRHERAETVGELACVDRVVTFDTLQEAILILRPRILVKGSDWRGRLSVIVVDLCDDLDVIIVYTDTQERTSTERLAS